MLEDTKKKMDVRMVPRVIINTEKFNESNFFLSNERDFLRQKLKELDNHWEASMYPNLTP